MVFSTAFASAQPIPLEIPAFDEKEQRATIYPCRRLHNHKIRLKRAGQMLHPSTNTHTLIRTFFFFSITPKHISGLEGSLNCNLVLLLQGKVGRICLGSPGTALRSSSRCFPGCQHGEQDASIQLQHPCSASPRPRACNATNARRKGRLKFSFALKISCKYCMEGAQLIIACLII